MNIAFLTEGNWVGKVVRDFSNMRTDLAWQCALQSDHFYILTDFVKDANKYDYAFVILPKNENILKDLLYDEQNSNIKFIDKVKRMAKKVCFMQEGPNYLWQDYSIEIQTWFLSFLFECDLIFCHNEYDKIYYQGLLANDNIHVLPSLMIEDSIKNFTRIKDDEENIIIGGNFCSWYGGINSYMVAREIDPQNIFIPSMGRKKENEEHIPHLKHLVYQNWINWIHLLTNFKYAIHLMPTIAAGTFSLNCAYLGIPCIGNEKVDTQRICFPDLSVDVCDIKKAKELLLQLKKDSKFYEEVVDKAKKAYDNIFKEEHFLNYMNNILE